MQTGIVTALLRKCHGSNPRDGNQSHGKFESFGIKLVKALIAIPQAVVKVHADLCCACSRHVSAAVTLHAVQLNALLAQGSAFE